MSSSSIWTKNKNPFEIKIDLGSRDSITFFRIIMSTYVRFFFFFLFEFPSLLLGIWLAVTTAQTLNGLQSRKIFFPLLVCLFLLPNLWNVCVCVWSLRGTEMCVDERLLTDQAVESTYRENLTTLLRPECLCPHGDTLPSSPCFFAQHVWPRGALLPASNCHTHLGL